MYERSAIVLEKYIEKILRFNNTYNLKKNSEDYAELLSKLEIFQKTTEKDTKVIQEFDDTVKKIENIQKEQEKLYNANRKLEDDRIQLFSELGEDYKVLDNKLKKIEYNLEKNNEEIIKLREQFIKNLQDFSQKQKDRNKCDKEKRLSEARIIKCREEISTEFNEIDVQDMLNLKDFIASEKDQVKQEALEIMTKNGKNEKVSFDQDVLRKAVNNRIDIAEKEAECYVLIFNKMKKLLSEPDNESIKLEKYKKILRETNIKLAFLKMQKEYIFGFLDYERMTAVSSSIKVHKKVMADACNNFELDMIQIKNLYELLLKEIDNKASEKAYRELYNKNYLKSIKDKEKNFEEEANNVNLKAGTLINSNYWRIEGIKNIYMVFQDEITKNFGKDLSAYQIKDIEDDDIEDSIYENKIYKSKKDEYNYKENYKYVDEDEAEEDIDVDIKYDDDIEDTDDEDDYNNNEDEYEDEYDDEDEYEDEYETEAEEDNNKYYDEYDDDDEYYEEDYYSQIYANKDENEDIVKQFYNDDIDSIIKNSREQAHKKSSKTTKRAKTIHKSNKEKGLFNKFFKK